MSLLGLFCFYRVFLYSPICFQTCGSPYSSVLWPRLPPPVFLLSGLHWKRSNPARLFQKLMGWLCVDRCGLCIILWWLPGPFVFSCLWAQGIFAPSTLLRGSPGKKQKCKLQSPLISKVVLFEEMWPRSLNTVLVVSTWGQVVVRSLLFRAPWKRGSNHLRQKGQLI